MRSENSSTAMPPASMRRLKRKSFIAQLILFAIGVQILFIGSFCQLELPTPTGRNLHAFFIQRIDALLPFLPTRYQEQVRSALPELNQALMPVRLSPYVPLAPLTVFVAYTLGLPLSWLSGLVFLLIGLIGPSFGILPWAEGGGWNYYKEPGFGYLLGMVAASYFSARIVEQSRDSLHQLFSLICGLACIHLTGITYLLGVSLGIFLMDGEGANPVLVWQPWLFENIRNLTYYSLPYDLFFSLIMVGLSFPFRWLVNILTISDTIVREKPTPPRYVE